MRLIGSLSEEKQAQLFTDYLLSHDIRAEVEQDDSQWSVWVKDEDKLSLARGCLEEFRADPAAPRFREAATQAVALRQEDERRRHTQAKQTVDVRRDLWSQPTARRAPLTMVLAIACVVVAMASNMGQNRRSQMVRALAFADPVQRISKRGEPPTTWGDIQSGQVWRLVTPIFIHYGLAHIAFNLIWLFSLGAMIEVRRSAAMLGLVVLAAAVAGNVGQALVTGPIFGGMSGVVYGLLGFIWVRMYLAPGDGLRVSRDYILIMMIWMVLGFIGVLDRAFDIRVANAAHLCGLMGGVLVAILLPVGRRRSANPA